LLNSSESIFPPQIKQIIFFPKCDVNFSLTTITLVAAAPSDTILCSKKFILIPSAIFSSLTKTKSSTNCCTILNVNLLSKPILPPRQSAKVSVSSTSTGLPYFRLSYIEGPLSIDTAIIFVSGF